MDFSMALVGLVSKMFSAIGSQHRDFMDPSVIYLSVFVVISG